MGRGSPSSASDASGIGQHELVRGRCGSGGALAGGFQARRITDAGANLDWDPPRWSPDGTELAAAAGTSADCIAYYCGHYSDAFVVKADGSGSACSWPQSDRQAEYSPTWSPTESKSAFQRSWMWSESACSPGPAMHHGSHGRQAPMVPNPRRLDGLLADQSPGRPHSGPRMEPDWWGSLWVEMIRWPSFHLLCSFSARRQQARSCRSDPAGIRRKRVAAPLPPAPSFAASR